MKIPYVIDNISTRLADVLNTLLSHQPGQQFDVATAYFSIRGFQQVRYTLPTVGRFRLATSTNIFWPLVVNLLNKAVSASSTC